MATLLDIAKNDSDPANRGEALTWLFVTLGIVYFAIMMLGVANIRVPSPGWRGSCATWA